MALQDALKKQSELRLVEKHRQGYATSLSGLANSMTGKSSRRGVRNEAGEIRWYRFQAPDKKRPVLIIHRDDIIDHLAEVTIAPLTTTVRDIPSEVFLSAEAERCAA